MDKMPTGKELVKDFRTRLEAKFKGKKLTNELKKEIRQFIHVYMAELDFLYGTSENEPTGFLN